MQPTNGPTDPPLPPTSSRLVGGLDLSRMDDLTEDERSAMRTFYEETQGRPHVGLNVWLDLDQPGPLKRYRAWTDRLFQPPIPVAFSTAMMILYSLMGYDQGIRYIIRVHQQSGLTKSQCMEILSLAFLWNGPRGMETYAKAIEDFAWIEPSTTTAFPKGWGPDPAALRSGLDFASDEVTVEELRSLEQWYLRWEGEVPGYVRLLARYRPDVLKTYRNRFEHTLRELPKQLIPYVMIVLGVTRGLESTIREGLLLAKGFGMSREEVLSACSWGSIYGGMEALSLVESVGGTLLDRWGD